jgi:hypothetical protein
VPFGGIELDNSSHVAEARKQRDQFVNGVFKAGGLPLLHVPARVTYNPGELREQISALGKKPSTAA